MDLSDHVLPPEPPELGRDASYTVQAACNFTVSRHMARTVINQCGGDLNLAMLKLLALSEKTPVEELCEFGGIARDAAENYLRRASNNLEIAKNLIIQDIIVLGAVSDGRDHQVQCPCCMDTYPFSATVTLDTCEHVFCLDCLKSWISAECSASSTGEVRCPRAHECTGRLTQNELRILMPAEEFRKLDRRALETAVQADPTLRICSTPDCAYIVSWSVSDGPPLLNCPLCYTQRCLACGVSPYHTSMTCDEAAAQRETAAASDSAAASAAEAEEATRKYMESSGIRVCKQCGIGVEMTSGCLKMKCRCGYRFCYRCGSENARCGCTPASHGFWDNELQRGDFSNLR